MHDHKSELDETETLADAIEELRTEAEEIEEAMWTIRKVLGRDNVAVYKVCEKLKRCLEANLAAVKKLESKSHKRTTRESGQND